MSKYITNVWLNLKYMVNNNWILISQYSNLKTYRYQISQNFPIIMLFPIVIWQHYMNMCAWIIAYRKVTSFKYKKFKDFMDLYRTLKISILEKARSNVPVAYHLFILKNLSTKCSYCSKWSFENKIILPWFPWFVSMSRAVLINLQA